MYVLHVRTCICMFIRKFVLAYMFDYTQVCVYANTHEHEHEHEHEQLAWMSLEESGMYVCMYVLHVRRCICMFNASLCVHISLIYVSLCICKYT
jgi:hypothetical protein